MSAHRAVSVSTLDQLDDAELMVKVAALQLSGRHDRLLTNSTVFKYLYFSNFSIVSRHYGNLLLITLVLESKLDERKVLFHILHELSEFHKVTHVTCGFMDSLKSRFADQKVGENTDIESSHQDKLAKVD